MMDLETTYTTAIDQLKSLMDRVVAADELGGLLETPHLLRSPRNAARLLLALERARFEALPSLPLEDLETRRSFSKIYSIKSKPIAARIAVCWN